MSEDKTLTSKEVTPPGENVPGSKQQREKILEIVRTYVKENSLVCPLSMDELRTHSEKVVTASGSDANYRDFIAVLINNQTWHETVSRIPFNKRLLLLPNCLRNHQNCRAEFDRFGLICEHCGGCIINELKTQAEKIGYAVLVAEGSPIVMSLIESGKVEAVIGVSCLSVLERTFPYMQAGAVPGIAIPLLHDGCQNTNVDIDWVLDAMYLSSEDKFARLNLDSLRKDVDSWFTAESLKPLLSIEDTQTEQFALSWLSREGKRWRPFLAACAYRALTDDDRSQLSDQLKKVAIAVECFHKASLIHDDIEDGDMIRYGQKTLHAAEGIPVALNVGDLLLGEGYRLIAECGADDKCSVDMLAAAAAGHRQLCLGQGSELSWATNPKPLTEKQVIDIFRKKTSPAFAVALKLGAIFAGASDDVIDVLDRYSLSLGIAYQIKDDLDDLSVAAQASDLKAMRPSLLLAMAYRRAEGDDKKLLRSVWDRSVEFDLASDDIQRTLESLCVRQTAFDLMQSYKARAIGSLARLRSSALKGLLRRVVYKIFNDTNIMGCCNDDKTGSDQRRQLGKENSGPVV